MNTVEFLNRLKSSDITVKVDGDRLRLNAPKDALTPDLRDELARRKSELIGFLRSAATGSSLDETGITPLPRTGPLPLSFMQQQMWFLSQLEPDSPAYNMVWAIRMEGTLDAAIFQQALDQLVARHESLRTIFRSSQGVPEAIVLPPAPVLIQTIATAAGETDVRRAEGATRAREMVSVPMDLERGPLFSPALICTGEKEHLFIILIHHIVADGWSLGVFLRDLTELYAAAQDGRAAVLSALPFQFADFAGWQRTQAALAGSTEDSAPDTRGHLKFWREHLAGVGPTSTIPPSRPRPAQPSHRGALRLFAFDEPLTEAIQNLATQSRSSTYMVLLAGLHLLVHRYSGQQDLVIGAPVAGRATKTSEQLIGPFLNMLPLRARIDGSASFANFLAKVRDDLLAAMAHENTSFEQIIDGLNLTREAGIHPLFQVMFAFQNFPLPRMELPGLQLTSVPLDRGVAQFDLNLFMAEDQGRLVGALEYSTDLYDAAMIERLTGHFVALVHGAVSSPETPISQLGMLEAREREQVLHALNATEMAYPREKTVVDLFGAQARRRPAAVAVTFEGASLTYAQLDEHSNRLARHLQGLGVAADSLVGLCVERGLDMLVGVLGILKAGAAYVPLDPGFPAERLHYMLEDSTAAVLVTQQALGQRLFPTATLQRVCLDGDAAAIQAVSSEPLPLLAIPAGRAYVLYTSGSTGRPKGVQIDHLALTNFLCSMAREPGIAENDVLVALTTLSFDIAGLELFLPLSCGARIELVSRESALDGVALGQVIASSGATILQATPATWRMLFESGWQGERRLKALCGGEAMSRDLAQRLIPACASLWNMYGPTETTIWSSLARISQADDITIGRPIANTQMYVLDAHGQPVPHGVVGELWIGGEGVARGYLKRPELDAERFRQNPFHAGRMYRTGDLARHLPDGRLDCLGRVDNQVKVRGYRIELGEIEAVLDEHPGVVECAVVARQIQGDTRLIAYLTGQADPAACREHLRSRLPEYMVPAAFVTLAALPKTPNNKIDRNALPTAEGSALLPARKFVPPATDTEKLVAAVFAEVLGVQQVGIQDNFFELGGNSLLATRLVARLRASLGTKVPLRGLFSEPTVFGLARRLRYTPATRTFIFIEGFQQWRYLVPIQPKGTREPLFLVAGAHADEDVFLRYLSNMIPHLGMDQPVFGFKAKGLDGIEPGHATVEEMARDYIEELRSFKPNGPYVIAGECVGGVVAFEMAQQLCRSGEIVRKLILLDTERPTTFRRGVFKGARLVKRIRNAGRLLARTLLAGPGKFGAALSALAGRIGKKDQPRDPATVIAQRIRQVERTYPLTTYNYHARAYAERLTIIVNKETHSMDPHRGWKSVAHGGLEIHVVPGDHRSRLTEYGRHVAERILECINRA